MTARCGSIDPTHTSIGCRGCDRLYKRRHRAGLPRLKFRLRANAAKCAVCGLAAGNSMDVPVYRYTLKRHIVGSKQQVYIGSIGLCDRCIGQHAELNEKFRVAA